MDPNQAVQDARLKLSSAVEHLQNELKKVRTGRANAGMLDGVTVDAYGSQMPLNQVATIATPDAQLLQITPFDPNNLQAIAAAIRNNQSLGLNPADDGRVVRVPIPPLTEERRRDLVKQIGEKVEESMIAMRNVRHDLLKSADTAKKDKSISEDDVKRIEKQIDDLMMQQKQAVDQLAKAKEAELMTI
jgi:ribosome recycling factor